MTDLVLYLLVVGSAGYALGRLVARDTVLDPVRGPFLRWIGGPLKPVDEALIETGMIDRAQTHPTGWRLHLVEGLTCPSCVGFWFVLGLHLGLGLHPLAWQWDILAVFGAWAVTGVLARKAG